MSGWSTDVTSTSRTDCNNSNERCDATCDTSLGGRRHAVTGGEMASRQASQVKIAFSRSTTMSPFAVIV